MGRSKLNAHTSYLDHDAEEYDALMELMSVTGSTSDANLMRLALVCFARHLGRPQRNHIWALRTTRGLRGVAPRPKTAKVVTARPVAAPKPPRVRQPESRPQPQSHPWRHQVIP